MASDRLAQEDLIMILTKTKIDSAVQMLWICNIDLFALVLAAWMQMCKFSLWRHLFSS